MSTSSGPHIERKELRAGLRQNKGEISLKPVNTVSRPVIPEHQPISDSNDFESMEIDVDGDPVPMQDDPVRYPVTSHPIFEVGPEERPRKAHGSPKLHAKSDMTVVDMCVAIIAFARKFSMTDEGSSSLLELISMALPEGHGLPKTVKGLEQVIDSVVKDGLSPMTTEYCESCPDNVCRCGHPTAYFVQNDHETLYKRLVRQHFNEIRQYPAFVQSQTSGYQDVQNGQAYKDRLKEVPIGHTPLPMNLFVDGGSFSNSTTTQTWPICLSLLSLDPVRRQSAKNVLIIGFWHGPKPNWAFIAKRIAECVDCSVVIDGFPYYVFIAVLTADMPGRAAFLNAMNHGAIDGCLFCDVKGLKEAGKGMQYDVIGELRTVEQFWADAKAADVLNSRGRKKIEHVGASKGTCETLTLVKTPTEVAIDAMHTTYEGPPRDDLEKLVEGNKDAKISKLDAEEREQIEDVIADIPWPYECDRKLRSLGDCKRWKASEWALFVTAVAPTIVAKVLAPTRPLQALSMLLLSAFVHLVSAPFIPHENLIMAQKLIDYWHHIRKDAWGPYAWTLKAHEMLHIPQKIRINGPPRCYSGFSGENVIGLLGRLITHKAKKTAATQMRDRYNTDHKIQIFQLNYRIHPTVQKLIAKRSRRVRDSGVVSALSPSDEYYHMMKAYSGDQEAIMQTRVFLGGVRYDVYYEENLANSVIFYRDAHDGDAVAVVMRIFTANDETLLCVQKLRSVSFVDGLPPAMFGEAPLSELRFALRNFLVISNPCNHGERIVISTGQVLYKALLIPHENYYYVVPLNLAFEHN